MSIGGACANARESPLRDEAHHGVAPRWIERRPQTAAGAGHRNPTITQRVEQNTSVPSRAAPAPLSLVPTRFRFPCGTGGAVLDTYPTDTDAFRSTITTRVTAGRSQIPTR